MQVGTMKAMSQDMGRVTALAEKPYFDEKAPTRRQALGIAGPDE